MLRLLCLVACFLVNSVIAAEKYIRVTGEATTIEQAKENAFRTAVQQRAGAIVLSERQSVSGKLTKDDISLFSAGYVDDFKIIDINQNGSTIKITLDVLVADSKILNQVLSTGKTNQSIDGERAATALNTFVDQKQKGDRVLDAVLKTYPKNAFKVEQKPYSLYMDSYRNTILEIPYSLKWNYDYIVAMNEAMTLVEDKVNIIGFLNQAPSNVIIMAKNPKDFLIGSKNYYKFNDRILLDRIKDSFLGENELRMMLLISGSFGNMLYRTCFTPITLVGRSPAFYGIGDPKVLTIYGNQTETSSLNVVIAPENNFVIQYASKIEVLVVPLSECRW
jgi:hypothetical protein